MNQISNIIRPAGQIRKGLLQRVAGTPLNAILTLFIVWVTVSIVIKLTQWAIIDAAFFPALPKTCQSISGACWSFVIAKRDQILFGIFPSDERWRPALVCVLLLLLLGYSLRPASWRSRLAFLWLFVLSLCGLLLLGGVFGLAFVPTSMWGGLPVTLLLTVLSVGSAFPLGILLALGRQSNLPIVSSLSTAFIEVTRALPLLSILFIASIMLPLLIPEMFLPDKFFRALIALLFYAAVYLAEIFRGGLQGISAGQYEAAKSLGLTYWQTQHQIILPQAIRLVIPALTSTVIVMIKNTSLVMVVGLFDLISSGQAALADPEWSSPVAETYIFIAAIYFGLCFGFGRFAEALEHRSKVKR